MKTKKKSNKRDLIMAFEEATKLSVTMAALPVLFLLIGVALDHNFGTKPLFIIAGIFVGIISGLAKAVDVSKNIKNTLK